MQWIQTGFSLFNSTIFREIFGTLPTTILALGGPVQIIYCTCQVIFISKLVFQFSKQTKRNLKDNEFYSIFLYLISVNLLDWIGVGLFVGFTFFGRNYLLNNAVSALVGIHASSAPITLSKLTKLAIDKPKPSSRLPSTRKPILVDKSSKAHNDGIW
jgi:hypothetical protein